MQDRVQFAFEPVEENELTAQNMRDASSTRHEEYVIVPMCVASDAVRSLDAHS